MTRRGKERSREPAESNFAAWPSTALCVCGAAESLACGFFLHLFAADGAGVLVAVVFLDCRCIGRRTGFPDAASVDRAGVFCRGDADVFAVGAANAHDGSGQEVVAFAESLYSK